MYVVIYVEDISIVSEDKTVESIITQLKQEYELKDSGFIEHFMGTKVRKIEKAYTLNQKIKIKELVNKLNLQDTKPVGTPVDCIYYKMEDEES